MPTRSDLLDAAALVALCAIIIWHKPVLRFLIEIGEMLQ